MEMSRISAVFASRAWCWSQMNKLSVSGIRSKSSRLALATNRTFISSTSSKFRPLKDEETSTSAGPEPGQNKEDSSARGQHHSNTSTNTSSKSSKTDEQLKGTILDAALIHVNSIGWNLKSISEGAKDLGLSPEVANSFHEFDLVGYFIKKCNQDLENHLSSVPLPLQESLKYRLEIVIPYVKRYNEALAFIARPENVSESLRLLLILSDSIAYHSLKDRSSDLSWYGKRLGIASIYAATELSLIQDKSSNYTNTWNFLDRRVKDYELLAKSTPLSLPANFFSVGLMTIGNMLGRNRPR